MKIKLSLISIAFSFISVALTLYQNYRLACMYELAQGKTKALFGITEIREMDKKVYIGIISIAALIIGYIALRKQENKKLAMTAIFLGVLSIALLFIRLWTYI
jgi:hypothetical protein